ncbi:uncharacterized protein LOC120350601 isoform X1 [Nilaparvata lugens]|uniref:uncharacterized protein LOC120350601 isoform X1 n=1 Tax=Nilaparvata lugens TaxID=108931 RepID=UPI00193CE850|nr:uncharacterized protein LOC120350601 isoform X1 [Nilaparvata lugens]
MKINLIFFSVVLLLPFNAIVAIQEAKSWDEFESIMTKGGCFCLVLLDYPTKEDSIKIMNEACNSYPKVKCYYGMADPKAPPTSFNVHYHSVGIPALYYYKDGKLITTIDHPSDVDTTRGEIEAGLASLM